VEKLRWDFRNLDIWKKARELRLDVESLVKTFPKEETFRLVDQMVRAIRSVTANIAEGHGRFHYQENIQFCRQARASLFELLDHLIVAKDNLYIQDEQYYSMENRIEDGIKLINGYVRHLHKKKAEERPHD
jgi:four helix bundle protein